MRFAVNIAMLFTELPFLQRFSAAADAGFDAVEFWWPDPRQRLHVRKAAATAQVDVVRFALDPGASHGGMLCHPDRIDEFRDSALMGLEFATELGCRMVNAMVGTRDPAFGLHDQLDCGRRNLVWLADAAMNRGITVLIEANCEAEKPAYLINTTIDAKQLVAAVGRTNVALLYDAYHMHRTGEDVARTFATHLPAIAHVQIADAPNRHEPGTGEMDYGTLLPTFYDLGYRGYVGLEYRPATTTMEGMSWLPRELRSGVLERGQLVGLGQ